MAPNTVYFGTFAHSKNFNEIEILKGTAVGVDAEGTIVFIDSKSESGDAAAKTFGWKDNEYLLKDLSANNASFFFPGFFDTHIHASQYPNAGLFGKTTLLDWLNSYTFPLESSFADPERAKLVYSKVIARTLANGTTTAAYYATVHVDGTNILADLAFERGQRAFIGRCCMNANSPDFYCDKSLEDAQESTISVVDHIKAIDPEYKIVSPILTPRFAPSCTKELMEWLGAYAKENNLPIQTHVSENKNEVAWVKELHPYADSYSGVYDHCGLLTKRTILAHAVHLTDSERDLLAARGTGVSHCPVSNSSLTSGETRVRWLLDGGVNVGLGTDVSGGYTPSILHTARQAILVSRHLAMKGDDSFKLSIENVLHLATLGGAAVCGMSDILGNFEVGKKFDAQFIDLTSRSSPVDVFPWELQNTEDLIAKWLFNGDDRNVSDVWVNGRLVLSQNAS
ncbi:hypothetical protein V1511DRAFT_456796 [Dipodascopsis uninucleata]